MRRSLRYLLRALLAGLLLLSLLVAALCWSQQGSGLLYWLGRVGLQAQGLQGGLWQGLRIERLQGPQGLDLRGLVWLPPSLEWRAGRPALRAELRLAELRGRSPAAAASPREPEALLDALRLPLDLDLALRIERLDWDGLRLQGLGLALQARSAPLWRVQLQPLSLAGGRGRAEAELAADGGLAARAEWQFPGRQVLRLDTSGTLSRLQLRAALGSGLRAEAALRPLQNQPFESLDLKLQQLDLRQLHPAAPQTRLAGQLQARVDAQGLARLEAELRNAAAARLDQGGWPLRALQAQAELRLQDWRSLRLQGLELELGGAEQAASALRLQQASAVPDAQGRWSARLALRPSLPLQALHRDWPAARLEGVFSLGQTAAAAPLRLELDGRLLADQAWRLQSQAELRGARPEHLQLRLQGPQAQRLQAQADWADTQLQLQAQASGEWQLPGPWKRQLHLLDLQLDARLQAAAMAELARAPGQARLQLREGSRWAELPLQGELGWARAAPGAPAQASLTLRSAGDSLQLAARESAALPMGWQPLRLRAELAELERLRPWWQPWLRQAAGRLSLQAENLEAEPHLRLQAQGLRLQRQDEAAWRLGQLDARLDLDAQRLALELQGQDLRQGDWQAARVAARVQGPWSDQQWQLEAQARRGEQDWQLRAQARAQGRWGDLHWQELELRAGPGSAAAALQLRAPALHWQGANWTLAPARLELLGQELHLQAARAAAGWQLALQGEPQLQPWLRPLRPELAELRGDLQAALSLNLSGGADQPPRGELLLRRLGGDLALPDDSGQARALELQTLELRLVRAATGSLQAQLGLASQAHGSLAARFALGPDEALQGELQARLPQLQALDPWLPSGLRLQGSAQAQLRLGGSRQQPQLHGEAQAQGLGLQHPASGFAAQQGELALRFDGQRAQLLRAQLSGLGADGGRLQAQGQADWSGAALQAELSLQAAALRLLQRFDRQLVLSGDSRLLLRPQRLQLQGALTVDQGRFDLGRADAPRLGEDVQVLRPGLKPAAATSAPAWLPEVDLRLDLGQRLTVRGRGLQTRVTGQLRVQQPAGKPARWSGQIESNGGRYRAYGQDLEIETGVLSFDKGLLDDPRLDLLAVRPDLEQRVGVRVDGRAQAPRVRLYSDPALSDTEVLSWLLLGRAPDELGRGDAALLQRAALALLSGEGESPASELMGRLGLTELSLSPTDEGERVLRLGARLSRRWSLAYERSLGEAVGSWQLAYRLGQRFTLRARTGSESGVDLLWLWRYD